MSVIGYAFGTSVLVVGVEPDPVEVDESGEPLTRVYIDARYLNRYVLVNAVDGEAIRRAWGAQHLVIDRPPADAIYQEIAS